MIVGLFHQGSGLADQLFRYITVRSLAQKNGVSHGMIGEFKGDFFLEKPTMVSNGPIAEWHEKDVRDSNGLDIRSYDPEINFVEDNTLIDGSFEDDKYWRWNLENINKWLAVEPLDVPNDLCVIGFRGGEYATQPDLFLTLDYYQEAIKKMRQVNPQTHFEVHTDDPQRAFLHFYGDEYLASLKVVIVKNEPISHSKHTNMAFNWRSARYAKYAIIPNSAFFIIPRLLKHFEDPTAVTIAPRYWARRNTKTWARPACYYPEFTYV